MKKRMSKKKKRRVKGLGKKIRYTAKQKNR
jgi:hypothetical protein